MVTHEILPNLCLFLLTIRKFSISSVCIFEPLPQNVANAKFEQRDGDIGHGNSRSTHGNSWNFIFIKPGNPVLSTRSSDRVINLNFDISKIYLHSFNNMIVQVVLEKNGIVMIYMVLLQFN